MKFSDYVTAGEPLESSPFAELISKPSGAPEAYPAIPGPIDAGNPASVTALATAVSTPVARAQRAQHIDIEVAVEAILVHTGSEHSAPEPSPAGHSLADWFTIDDDFLPHREVAKRQAGRAWSRGRSKR